MISHSARGVGQGSGGQGKSGLMWKLQDGKGFVSFTNHCTPVPKILSGT